MSEQIEKQQELLLDIGRRLRSAREAQGLSIRDVAMRTRIHGAYLDKIEQGITEGLPALTFVRGFMRNYIQTLGLDDHALTEALIALGQSRTENPPPQPLKATTTEKLLGMETERTNWTRWVLVGALAILLVWVGYLVVRVSTSGDSAPAPVPAAPAPAAPGATPGAPPAPAIPPNPAGSPNALPRQSSVPPGAPGRPAAVTEPRANLRLTVRGLEDTWLRLSTDREPPVEVRVKPAETLNFDANEEIRLTVGKSQGVSVYLNGEEVQLPTEKNRLVAEMVLNKLSLLRMQN